jgi:hypothetical protein
MSHQGGGRKAGIFAQVFAQGRGFRRLVFGLLSLSFGIE